MKADVFETEIYCKVIITEYGEKRCPGDELFSGGYLFAKYWPDGVPEFIALQVGTEELAYAKKFSKHIGEFYFSTGFSLAKELMQLLKEKGKPEWTAKARWTREHIK